MSEEVQWQPAVIIPNTDSLKTAVFECECVHDSDNCSPHAGKHIRVRELTKEEKSNPFLRPRPCQVLINPDDVAILGPEYPRYPVIICRNTLLTD